jgi:hypothetical protein
MHTERAALVYQRMEDAGPAWQVDLPIRNESHANMTIIKSFQKNYILESQAIAKNLGNRHETAKASRTHNWITTCGGHLNPITLCLVFERKHKHIQDGKERQK